MPASLRSVSMIGLVMTALLLLIPAPQAQASTDMPAELASSDTSTRWGTVSEASNCGSPYTRTPFVSRSGPVSSSEPILGPFGTYFGRSVTQVSGRMVNWTVPGSGGRRVLVHQNALPAFRRVADGLRAEAASGRTYSVTSVQSFVSRTISGSSQLSRHALGLAIDINPPRNPYRADNRLITNMPGWYVDVWRDAGFCWGGDWTYTKDPMHFSWMGPEATTSTNDPFEPIPPTTTLRAFGVPIATHSTEFGPVLGRYATSIADAVGNGAPDVVGVRSHPDGSVIDITSSTNLWGECSVSRWFVPDTTSAAADFTVFADIDSDSGQDLVTLTSDQASMIATVATRRNEFKDVTVKTTGLDPTLVAIAGADFDRDRRADLWEVLPNGEIYIYGGNNFDVLLHSSVLPGGAPAMISAADRDGGDTPELFALYGSGAESRVDVLTLDGTWNVDQSFSISINEAQIEAFGSVDYDGDGRSDLQVLDSQGSMTVYIGNSATGAPAGRWFTHPDQTCDDDEVIPLDFSGLFYDDEGNIFESAIDKLGASGITAGCNPPFNDNFCPNDRVTRGQMAAFLVRALGYIDNGGGNLFTDDDGHLFEGAIDKLGAAGVTQGCNPPANTRFCPNRYVTRGEMAAFLVRALGYTDNGGGNLFTDDDGHLFEGAIDKLGAAGVTQGCNPPNNTRYCPNEYVTRGQMAAFLARALDL